MSEMVERARMAFGNALSCRVNMDIRLGDLPVQVMREAMAEAIKAMSGWQPIETAPKDGNAFLGYGRHTRSPPDAQRGVKAGDHWWAIMLWDVWRGAGNLSEQWVFAKDGRPTWSEPTHWMPLPDPPGA